MLLEHERNYGLGMDALVSVCSWNTNGIGLGMDALAIALTGTRTELWFGHGCSGEPMLATRGLIRILEVLSLYSARRGVGRLNPKTLSLKPKNRAQARVVSQAEFRSRELLLDLDDAAPVPYFPLWFRI